jgi:hypothetical protein
MTKKEAIKKARKNVGELYKFGDGYKYNYWDFKTGSWRESYPKDYYQARFGRSKELIFQAVYSLNEEEGYEVASDIAIRSLVKYSDGNWVEYV